VPGKHPKIRKVLSYISSIAAGAALLLVTGCATSDAQARQDLASLRTEVRTLQQENAELARRVESMSTQIDLLVTRSARTSPVPGTEKAPAAAAPAVEAAPQVPAHLKVVKLEKPKGATPVRTATPAPASSPPPIPTATPIQDPSPAALASLAGGRSALADAQSSWEAARARSGLGRARALESFADAYPSSPRAPEGLVDAARTRQEAGDPDGACEDYTRVFEGYPTSRAAPDAMEGLGACEQRRGRSREAQSLQARLARDFPDSPAGKRAREHAPAVQGAAP
jgi:TolA-binding protein